MMMGRDDGTMGRLVAVRRRPPLLSEDRPNQIPGLFKGPEYLDIMYIQHNPRGEKKGN